MRQRNALPASPAYSRAIMLALIFSQFYTPIPAAPLIILGTYYLALYLIVVSIEDPARIENCA